MLIGDRIVFAIECHHEPIPNATRRVFGRMCLWFGDLRLGDPDEPACMLNVTELLLQRLLDRLDSLHDPSLDELTPLEAFQTLDRALYIDSGQSSEQVVDNAKRFFRFDFLTNGGESFDRTKSFIVRQGDGFRLLFRDDTERFQSADVPRTTFVEVTRAFLEWLSAEGVNAG